MRGELHLSPVGNGGGFLGSRPRFSFRGSLTAGGPKENSQPLNHQKGQARISLRRVIRFRSVKLRLEGPW